MISASFLFADRLAREGEEEDILKGLLVDRNRTDRDLPGDEECDDRADVLLRVPQADDHFTLMGIHPVDPVFFKGFENRGRIS